MFEDKTYKRCACKGPLVKDGKPVLDGDGNQKIGYLEKSCPQLRKRDHGTWYYSFELPAGPDGKRQRAKKGGFRTQEEAARKAKEVFDAAQKGVNVLSGESVAEYLERWIKAKRALKRTTVYGYRSHIDCYLIPRLGHIQLMNLRVHHIAELFEWIEQENERRAAHVLQVQLLQAECDKARDAWRNRAKADDENRAEWLEVRGKLRATWNKRREELAEARRTLRHPNTASTQHRIMDTLSSALEDAVKAQLITTNWAQLVSLPSGKRPKALVWTDERIRRWRRTGNKPSPVMVWTPVLTGQFLDFTSDDRLHPLWHLITFRGLRRGEACALSWDEVDLDHGIIHITEQIVAVAHEPFEDTPKADSVRDLTLDSETIRLLREWRKKQDAERAEWSAHGAWVESGRVFTRENGEGYHPQYFSDRFERLWKKADLPPIRLHDLRHGAATLALAAGVDTKVVQEMLGHSSFHLTMDTYTSVLPELDRMAAEASVSIVPRANKPTKTAPKKSSGGSKKGKGGKGLEAA
ncbi:tyrosine-type recombinase/integrase [Streptomyces sp. NPDC001156]